MASRSSQLVARDRRLVVVVQRRVLGDREVEHEPVALAILGNVADAGVGRPRAAIARVTSTPCRSIAPGVRHRACRRAPGSARSDRCRRRLRCRRSRRRRTSIDSPRTASRPRSSRTHRSRTARIFSPGMRGAALDVEQHLAADHQLGEAALARALAVDRSRPSCRAAAPRCGPRPRAPRAACA